MQEFPKMSKIEKSKTHPESTKFRKHEKKRLCLYNPSLFRAFIPSCFRDWLFLRFFRIPLFLFLLHSVFCLLSPIFWLLSSALYLL